MIIPAGSLKCRIRIRACCVNTSITSDIVKTVWSPTAATAIPCAVEQILFTERNQWSCLDEVLAFQCSSCSKSPTRTTSALKFKIKLFLKNGSFLDIYEPSLIHLGRRCTTRVQLRAKVFFDTFKGQNLNVFKHTKDVFYERSNIITQILGPAGQIKSHSGPHLVRVPYVVHAWSKDPWG